MAHTRIFTGLALAALACAASADTAKTPRYDRPDFGWLAESWCLQTEGAFIEEVWLPARGPLMLGMSRSTKKDGAAPDFEFLRIETVAGVPNYIAQPGGRPPTYFKLTRSEPNYARFENPQHDFPQYVEYRREGDRLTAGIGAAHRNDDVIRNFTFEYQACRGIKPAPGR
jgi:hypothetical protein